VEVAAVRQAFRSFVGDEPFRRFVRALNIGRQDRLLYWQERLWQRFASAHPAMDLPAGSIRWFFRFCEVHGCELERDVIPIVYGLFRFPPEYIEAGDRQFPYARTVACIDDCFRDERTEMEVDYCPACRRAEASWGGRGRRRGRGEADH
jgi:hypothetical protein